MKSETLCTYLDSFPLAHYNAKSELAHFCAIKSPKSTDVLLNIFSLIFSGFHCTLFWIPLTNLAIVQRCVHRNPLLLRPTELNQSRQLIPTFSEIPPCSIGETEKNHWFYERLEMPFTVEHRGRSQFI